MVTRAEVWLRCFLSSSPPPAPLGIQWKPKNPEQVQLYEDSRQARMKSLEALGRGLSRADWEEPGPGFWENDSIPFFTGPVGVETHVDIEVWRNLLEEVQRNSLPGCERQLEIAREVLEQLSHGASSGVHGAGLLPIQVNNYFEDLAVDPPRMLDALLKAIRNQTMSGPFLPSYERCRRINSFLSAPKPGGERRQVGDLSSPKATRSAVDKSFNGNVDPNLELCWSLTQLTAQQFSYMVRSMGKGAHMGKSDLSQAYKNIPVTEEQRKLQRFMFGGRVFEETRLVFGDTYAPMYFDRFHTVILTAFTPTLGYLPKCIYGKCIDDIPIVVPGERIDLLRRHLSQYKEICKRLNVKLSPMDAIKGFEEAQTGEVLGVVFNTMDLTWRLPTEKNNTLVRMLREVIISPVTKQSKEFWEKITGKLNNFYQLWPAGKFFIDNFIKSVQLSGNDGWARPSRAVARDAKVWLAVLEGGSLPIARKPAGPPPMHFRTFSDASGEFLDTPSVGILIPAQFGLGPRVASWEFPRGFLNMVDGVGKKCHRKTTTLEAIGMLSTILLAPDLLSGHSVVHVVDNIATCLAWNARRSTDDEWATVLVRAMGHVCAFLNIDLHTEWQIRRTDRYTEVVDNLSHDCCQGLNMEEIQSYISEPCEGFPEPLLIWMRSPWKDWSLGIRLVEWLKTVV